MFLTYAAERCIYHGVVGVGGIIQTLIIALIMSGLGALLYRGHLWTTLLLAPYMLLNGMGVPRGMSQVFGSWAPGIARTLFVLHLASAVALAGLLLVGLVHWLTGGRRSF
jgi:hypothetical protein